MAVRLAAHGVDDVIVYFNAAGRDGYDSGGHGLCTPAQRRMCVDVRDQAEQTPESEAQQGKADQPKIPTGGEKEADAHQEWDQGREKQAPVQLEMGFLLRQPVHEKNQGTEGCPRKGGKQDAVKPATQFSELAKAESQPAAKRIERFPDRQKDQQRRRADDEHDERPVDRGQSFAFFVRFHVSGSFCRLLLRFRLFSTISVELFFRRGPFGLQFPLAR